MDQKHELWRCAHSLICRKNALEKDGIHDPKSPEVVVLREEAEELVPRLATWIRTDYDGDKALDAYIDDNVDEFVASAMDTKAFDFSEGDAPDESGAYSGFVYHVFGGGRKHKTTLRIDGDLELLHENLYRLLAPELVRQYVAAAVAEGRTTVVPHVELTMITTIYAFTGVLHVKAPAVVHVAVLRGIVRAEDGAAVVVGVLYGDASPNVLVGKRGAHGILDTCVSAALEIAPTVATHLDSAVVLDWDTLPMKIPYKARWDPQGAHMGESTVTVYTRRIYIESDIFFRGAKRARIE